MKLTSPLNITHGGFQIPTLKNARGSQKLHKCAFCKDLHDNLTNFRPLNAKQINFYATTLKMKGEAKNAKMLVLVHFTHNCACCTRRIFLKI